MMRQDGQGSSTEHGGLISRNKQLNSGCSLSGRDSHLCMVSLVKANCVKENLFFVESTSIKISKCLHMPL